MQQLGFFMDFVLFVVPAFHYTYYAKEKPHIAAFQTMYFLSSFFNQVCQSLKPALELSQNMLTQ